MTSSRRPRAVLIGPWASARASGGALVSSGVVHLLLVIPTLVTLQIYDRVLSSRRVETLVMLLVAASASLLAWWLVETARVRWYAACAARLEQQLTGELAPWLLAAPAHLAGAAASQLWKDIAVVRGFVGGPALLGVIDLPWTPVYLLIIGAFHPLLGVVALAGILLLVGLGWLTEWRLRAPAAAAEQAQILTQRTANEVVGFSEVMRAHGQEIQVTTALATVRADAADVRLTAELAGHGLKTWGKLTRQALQLTMLAVGAWLVIQGQATGGVMIAGSILLGKALMPLEVLIGSWKQLLETRSALGRLRHALALQGRATALLPSTALPPAKGELRVTQLGFKPPTQDVAVLHRVNFELPAGAMLAVLGPSGSGKSTLARIIAGVHTPTHWLAEQLAQTRSEIGIQQELIATTSTALQLAQRDLAANEKLKADGFVSEARLVELQRVVADYRARVQGSQTQLAQARQKDADTRLKLAAQKTEFARAAADELKEVTARLAQITQELRPALDAQSRQRIVAPVAGEVVDLKVHRQ